MTTTISILSAKGGVGKTTTTANLGAALTQMKRDIVVLDGNITTPNLSLHLGIPLYPVTLHDVLKRRADIEDALYTHNTGLRIIPASLSADSLRGANADRLESILLDLIGKTEFILIDGAAGLGKEAIAAAKASDQILMVTNPELPAVTDALKGIKTIENKSEILGIVVNRVNKHKHEMSLEEVETMLDYPVIGVIPEDKNVPKAISMKIPVVNFSPRSRAAREFKRLAANLIGEDFKQERTFFEKFFGWMR